MEACHQLQNRTRTALGGGGVNNSSNSSGGGKGGGGGGSAGSFDDYDFGNLVNNMGGSWASDIKNINSTMVRGQVCPRIVSGQVDRPEYACIQCHETVSQEYQCPISPCHSHQVIPGTNVTTVYTPPPPANGGAFSATTIAMTCLNFQVQGMQMIGAPVPLPTLSPSALNCPPCPSALPCWHVLR